MPSFQKLNLSRPEIRVLEVQPAEHIEATLVCRLVNVTADDGLEFIALSALAGESPDTELIVISGARRPIPANLAASLRHVRAVFLRPADNPPPPPPKQQLEPQQQQQQPQPQQPSPQEESGPSFPDDVPGTVATTRTKAEKTPNWLVQAFRHVRSILPDASKSGRSRGGGGRPVLRVWLDALCINMGNAREAANRRAHMALAYGAARMTIAWLGPLGDTTHLAIKILRDNNAAIPPKFGLPEDRAAHPEHYAPTHSWVAAVSYVWAPYAEDFEASPYIPPLLDLLNRRYLNSGWILEELALARQPAFLVGDKMLSWSEMLSMARLAEELQTHESDQLPRHWQPLMHQWPLGVVYTLLREYEARQNLQVGPSLGAVSQASQDSASETYTPAGSGPEPSSATSNTSNTNTNTNSTNTNSSSTPKRPS